MSMAISGQWAVIDTAHTPVARVAAKTLRKRLEAVWSGLKAAYCDNASDPARVHSLRVATRRALVAMKAFHALLPRKQRSWFRKQLHRIRRAAGEARDLDVLTDHLAGTAPVANRLVAHGTLSCRTDGSKARSRLVAMLSKQRDVSRQPIREQYEALLGDDWLGRMEKLLESLSSGGKKPSCGRYAQQNFKPMVKQFFKIADQSIDDSNEIHQLRIEGKQLRYAMEIFATVFPIKVRTRCYDSLEQLQKMLGDFTDHCAAAGRFKRLSENTGALANREFLAQLCHEELLLAHHSRKEFLKWWTPKRRLKLQRRLGLMLQCRSA